MRLIEAQKKQIITKYERTERRLFLLNEMRLKIKGVEN